MLRFRCFEVCRGKFSLVWPGGLIFEATYNRISRLLMMEFSPHNP